MTIIFSKSVPWRKRWWYSGRLRAISQVEPHEERVQQLSELERTIGARPGQQSFIFLSAPPAPWYKRAWQSVKSPFISLYNWLFAAPRPIVIEFIPTAASPVSTDVAADMLTVGSINQQINEQAALIAKLTLFNDPDATPEIVQSCYKAGAYTISRPLWNLMKEVLETEVNNAFSLTFHRDLEDGEVAIIAQVIEDKEARLRFDPLDLTPNEKEQLDKHRQEQGDIVETTFQFNGATITRRKWTPTHDGSRPSSSSSSTTEVNRVVSPVTEKDMRCVV